MTPLLVLLAVLSAADAASLTVRPLSANSSIRDSLAGGEWAVFSIDVPAQSAARVVVKQEGIDVGVTLRRAGSDLPEHGLNLTAGPTGEELVLPPVSDAPATWNVFVEPTIPRATRGDFTISFQLSPADDRARAVADARQQHQTASDTSWGGDAKAFNASVVLYAKAAEAALAAGDKELAAESTYQSARDLDNLGRTPEAIETQRRALALFREVGRRDREARVLNRMGDLSRKLGEVADSQSYFDQALPIARDVKDLSNVADILNNSGLLMLTIGRWEEAIERLEAALPMAQEVGSANVETALTHNIGVAYTRLGVYDKAIESHERSLELKRRSNLPVRRTASTLHALANTYFESGDRAKAEETIRSALDLYEKSGDRTGQAEMLGTIGLMQHASGDTDRALQSFSRAVPLLREVQNRAAEGKVLRTWAAVDVDRGDPDGALEKLERSLVLMRAIADRAGEANALYVRALALQKKAKIDEAIAAISDAIAIVESMRGAIVRTELRTSYLATVRSYFDLYIDLLQQRGKSAEAFAVSERARARTLLESLAESASKIRKGVNPDLLKRERAIQAQLNAKEVYRAQVVLRDGEKSPRAIALGKDVERLLEEWKDAEAKIRAASPTYAALRRPEPVTIERVKTLLDSHTALIEYHLGATRSYAWVIDSKAITVHELPSVSTIDALARKYHQMLSRDVESLTNAERQKLSTEIDEAGQAMSAAVWKPVSSRARGKRLLIVADGALQYVPFAALPDGRQPLIVSHEIVYLPSASVLETIRRDSRPVAATATAAVFADPVFSATDVRVSGVESSQAAANRGVGPYQRLRFSRKEAEAIVAAAPGAFEAVDFSAAKKTLIERDLRKYRILHFATHGSLNTEQPELSGLVLSLVDQSGKSIDGYLRLHEIYNLNLDADLVVLSACQTALGKEVHGEGLIGLTRGFMYAGAARVVSSIWNVDDRASAQLMQRFYTSMLSNGTPPATALRTAQLALYNQPRWKNPHYWAAFGLQGEWR